MTTWRQGSDLTSRSHSADVDIWYLTISALDDDGIRALRAIIDDKEKIAADRYRDPGDRRRFVVRRAMRRSLLSTCLDVSPEAVRLESAPGGKPVIARRSRGNLYFSVSSSRDIVAIAVSPDADVGIDVECGRDLPALRDTATAFFTEAERAALDDLDASDLSARFFDIWTRKEALLKGMGLGLRVQPRCIDVLSATPVSFEDRRARRMDWSLHTLSLQHGYSAAVAVRHAEPTVEVREWIPGAAPQDANPRLCQSRS